ncbi:MAG: HEAT repeat domain-containing protein, partial [Betaproteobacteria bacterium]
MKTIILILLLGFSVMQPASAALDPVLVKQLAADDSDEKISAIQKLVQGADPSALKILKAMNEEALFAADDQVFIKDGEKAIDAASGTELSAIPANADSITINNRVRSELAGAMATLKLFDPDRALRFSAARELATSMANEPDSVMAPLLLKAQTQESDSRVKALLSQAYALTTLKNTDPAVRSAAAHALSGSGDPNVKNLLFALMQKDNEPDMNVRIEAVRAYYDVKQRIELSETIGRIFSGLSLGSILLLAALGLAITYGVMGVINMAHR